MTDFNISFQEFKKGVPDTQLPLLGQVALITGAGSGIGAECAKQLAKKGMSVVIADINLDSAKQTADFITHNITKNISKDLTEERLIEQAFAISMNVTQESEVKSGIETCIEKFGHLDLILANAGVQIVHPIDEFPLEDWKKILEIHGDGSFLCAKWAFKKMKLSGKGGKIIFMGSVHSHEASPLKSAYVFAKHGVLGLSRVVAKEGAAHHIHSYVICPGFVRTPLVDKQIPEQAKTLGISEDDVIRNVMLKNTVDGVFTTTYDVAHLLAFLAQDKQGALTGQSFNVSHGWNMN